MAIVTIYIDGNPVDVNNDDNLLSAVLSKKFDLPYFCWHPAMGSVGACRQCAVSLFQDENDTRGRLAMACMTPVVDGMRIGLTHEPATEFRENIISAMMTNHPHDCPVCAEGGECHLQDMTVMTSHSKREYAGKKRTFVNQNLGPLVTQEMNRCITCYRCVRYYKDYAGGTDFDVYGSRNNVCFGRQEDGVLESEFSGNLVEVCPTGVFTDKPFSKHYARKWDLQSAPSICTHCSIGCNLSVSERYGSTRRAVNRYNHRINGYFICDKGRYGIDYLNNKDRLMTPKGIHQFNGLVVTASNIARILSPIKGKRIVAIGSARASLEANASLKLMVGSENFATGYGKKYQQIMTMHKALMAKRTMINLIDIEQCDAILVLGDDITQVAARAALAIRQAIRLKSFDTAKDIRVPHWQDDAVRIAGTNQRSPLFLCQSTPSKLDDVATCINFNSPTKIAEITAVILAKLTGEEMGNNTLTMAEQSFVEQTSSALAAAKSPLIISSHSQMTLKLMSTLLQYVPSLPEKAELAIFPNNANDIGIAHLLDEQSLDLDDVYQQTIDGEIDGLIILEQSLDALPIKQRNQLLKSAKTVVQIDYLSSSITEHCNVVLPSTPISESEGTFVNYQGEIQAFYPVMPHQQPLQQAWQWLATIDRFIGKGHLVNVTTIHQLRAELANEIQHWPDLSSLAHDSGVKIARQSHRSSGRTAMMANQSVHETKTIQDTTTGFSFSMESGSHDGQHTMPLPYTWAPGWNSNQSISKHQVEVNGALIEETTPIYLNFVGNDDVIDRGVTESKENEFDVVPVSHLFSQGFLAQKCAVFDELRFDNYVAMHSAVADKLLVNNCQYVEISNGSDNCYAKLFIDDTLPKAYWTCHVPLLLSETMLLTAVTADQHEHIEQDIHRRKLTSERTVAEQLSRVKMQDETIPIYLVSGDK